MIGIGINLEFVRHADKPFEWGVEKAAALGYTYVEPMVHWGRELLSEAGYFHKQQMQQSLCGSGTNVAGLQLKQSDGTTT